MIDNLETLFEKTELIKKQKGIVWFGISGSWRKINSEIEKSVRNAVAKIIANGNGIVSGGGAEY